jgi:aminocarboxymuconate-semialdehyde decarboxylase
VLLGTDYPFDMGVDDPVERVQEAAFAETDERAILSGNAADLLGSRLPGGRARVAAGGTA